MEQPVDGVRSDETNVDRKFEDGLRDLESLVEKLDAGDLPLEDALQAFEDGVGLVRFLEKKLTEVEKRVEILTRDAGGVFHSRTLETAQPEDDPATGRGEDA